MDGQAAAEGGGVCPHCEAGEESVWDGVLFHWAHPGVSPGKLKFCHTPWAPRKDDSR